MIVQNAPGYLQGVPDFAEGPESYVGEYPFPMPSPYGPSGAYPYPGQSMPYMPGVAPQPSWWRWPIVHWSWVNQFRPWRRPPFLPFWHLQRPFEESAFARQMARTRWLQQQGMSPGMMPGMPGAPYPGMAPMMTPGMPGAPGMPGFPGQLFPGAGGRRRRRRRRR